MIKNTFLRSLLSLTLLFSVFTASLSQAGYAQTAPPAPPVAWTKADQAAGLVAIEEKTEKRRKELGIPGMSLVIVKDDQIIFMKGLGYKDFEKQIAVTPDTEFAIGSASKAFTALSVLMSQDEGKLSLDDSPKKVLPYFKINDPDIDKNITIRDLMNHGSGLNRTDLAWITGKLTREEIIKVAGEAKPTAKLREKWQYQNVMFTAAGEIVAQVQKQPWEKFVPERIFKPLGMNNSTMSLKLMQTTKDWSNGYRYNFDTKETEKLPLRDIDEVAPAGSINSSARDMAQWLRFVMNGGVANGKRLVSEKGYEEWLKPQMKMGGKNSYGLGWFLQDWNGLKVVQHGGNIDGFNSLVAMIPEKKIGFVMLTNVSASPLGGELMPVIWENLLGRPEVKQIETASFAKLIGKYRLEQGKMDMEVKIVDGNLSLAVPGQPTYKLERTGDRQYKFADAEGFAVKFSPAQGDATEMYLQQPQGNYTLPRIKADGTVDVKDSGAAKTLVGKYESETNGKIAEVAEQNGKVTLQLAGQQPFTLGDKGKDTFTLSPLPEAYWLKVERDAAGKVTKIVVVQPEGEFGFKAVAGDKIKITSDELMQKIIDASGGEANLRKVNSRVSKFEIDLEHQGVRGSGTSYSKAPNKSATEMTLSAFGKKVATGYDYFDGTNGEDFIDFMPAEKYAGRRLDDVRRAADFYGVLDWKNQFKKIEIVNVSKVGDEEVYVVTFEPEKGTKFTDYYSTKTFLLLKRDGVSPSSTGSGDTPYSVTYSDYRDVDGIKISFKSVNSSVGMGNTTMYIKEVKHNVSVDDGVFKSKRQ